MWPNNHIAFFSILDSDDLCPETERSPVSTLPASKIPAKRFEIDGVVVWARSWDLASEIVNG